MIRIAHLYPYELSLYGESGNIKALTYILDAKNIKYEVQLIDKEDKLNFDEYDFIYLASGRTKYLEEVKKRLLPYKDDLLNYIEQEKILLATGNAVSILDFLDFYQVSYEEKRQVYDVEATTSLCKGNVVGFQNTEYLIKETKSVIFNLNTGIGNSYTKLEGFKYKNFYATTLIGPILARNNNLNDYFLELLTSQDQDF